MTEKANDAVLEGALKAISGQRALDQVVYLRLFAHRNDPCGVTAMDVAAEAGMSERAVRKSYRILKDLGFIQVERDNPRSSNGSYRANHYKFRGVHYE